ncbi:hypothetical protein CVT24_003024 [Panaeolus cyanescens]|uniref:Cytochrome P450 n=1 Tax=Panaeolus cyanescens TaxID=181874 RepID=A0A409W8U1_9AGAR|nr:hypothetical protein CVT24_003024 [Panaeolus cyanescens]
MSLKALLVFGACLWALQKFISKAHAIAQAKMSLGQLPGRNILLMHPFRSAAIAFAAFLPLKGQIGHYFAGFSNYLKYGSTIIGSIALWDTVPIYWTADGGAFRAASFDRPAIIKDVEAYEVLRIYGPNMVGAEGDDFRRHKNVAKSAFNEANVAFVWKETIRLLNDWLRTEVYPTFDEKKTDEAVEIDLLPVFTELTLLVIASAGFGKQAFWSSLETSSQHSKEDATHDTSETHHSLTFSQAVTVTISKLLFKILTPPIVQRLSKAIYIPWLTPAIEETTNAFESLRAHLLDVVGSARASNPQDYESYL